MMEDKKYYTPELSEFHVGFEFEVLSETFGTWSPPQVMEAVRFTNFFYIVDHLNNNRLRVKHLDHDDIVSLGWFIYSEDESGTVYKLNSDTAPSAYYKLYFYESINIEDYDRVIFSGHLLNKSELKRLMRQLSIIK